MEIDGLAPHLLEFELTDVIRQAGHRTELRQRRDQRDAQHHDRHDDAEHRGERLEPAALDRDWRPAARWPARRRPAEARADVLDDDRVGNLARPGDRGQRGQPMVWVFTDDPGQPRGAASLAADHPPGRTDREANIAKCCAVGTGDRHHPAVRDHTGRA